MPYTELLGRIRQLFKSDADTDLDHIARAFRSGAPLPPAQPMSDQELARAIREFQASEISDWTRQKLAKRLLDASKPANRRARR
jgi:hypothetical protein